jgi:uncharacterized protein YndB with AHSA1/START domain
MQTLHYSIHINASCEKTWNTMLDSGLWAEWTSIWMEGSYYEGEWKENAEISFMGPDKSGTKALITACNPHSYISMKHIAALAPGAVEDTESAEAKSWIGSVESYTFTNENGGTRLDIEIQTYPEWVKMNDDGWPHALKVLKKLAE